MNSDSKRAIFAALGANLGLAAAKFFGFTVTHSASLLAESVHSIADTGNQALLLWGASAANREATEEHPFGYGRERYFWSFVVALILFSLGSLFAINHGIDKLGHVEPLYRPQVAVVILLTGILLEGFSFYVAVNAAIPLKGTASWWSFIRRTKSPELAVVLLEDFGALLGLVIALIGVGLSVATGDARYDAGASIVIGLLLGVIAAILAYEMKSLLIGEGVNPEDGVTIRNALVAGDEVNHVIHMRTQHMSPDELLIGAKIELIPTLNFEEVSDAIDRAETRVRSALPSFDVTIYLEPDVLEANYPEAPAADHEPQV
ncbi:MAG: cation diffusion facilitator family transporter [Myxococcota bacterium]|jgi:cation diffusion facilitator family transporter